MKKTIYNDLETNLKNARKEDEITMRVNVKKQAEQEKPTTFKNNELFYKKLLIKTLLTLGYGYYIKYTNTSEKAISFHFVDLEKYLLFNSENLELIVPRTTGFYLIKEVKEFYGNTMFEYKTDEEIENDDDLYESSDGNLFDIMNNMLLIDYKDFIAEYSKK